MVAKVHQDNLERIKKNVKTSRDYFDKNYKSFYKFKRFNFESSLTNDEISVLQTLGKPPLEFNICEMFISRLLGEFIKQEPAIEVGAKNQNELSPMDPIEIKIIESHFRHILEEANNNLFGYRIYQDQLGGGFSAMKVWTDYEDEYSFNQNIYIGKCFDATLVGFDPLAIEPHKGDGEYCFEIFPMRKEDFLKQHPGMKQEVDNISFVRFNSGFNWSYKTNTEEILLVCDYYEKKKKNIRIVQLSDGRTMEKTEYENLLLNWESIEQPPLPVNERKSIKTIICRYRLIENKVIEYVETDYKYLPIIFVDGNSVTVRDSDEGALYQVTRPYTYQIKDAQKLRNFAGQTLANELENMVQHKWIVAKESIPEEYTDAYTNNQIPSTIVYNAFYEQDPEKPLPPPREVQRPPVPPEVASTFAMTDQMAQIAIGSFDAALGINNNQLSGKAIEKGSIHSNATAMPYVVGYLQALNQAAQIILDLIPKYYVTPRSIPIKLPDGKKAFVPINGQGQPSLQYDSNTLNISVRAGVSFSVQKTEALNQMIALMNVSPMFAQFMNQEGLEILLDNVEIRGIEELKVKSTQFMQQLKQQQAMAQQAQQQAMQNNPAILREKNNAMKLQLEAQQNQIENQLSAAEIINKEEQLKNDRLKIQLEAIQSHNSNMVQADKADAERFKAIAELAMKGNDQAHRHAKELSEFNHMVKESKNKNKEIDND